MGWSLFLAGILLCAMVNMRAGVVPPIEFPRTANHL